MSIREQFDAGTSLVMQGDYRWRRRLTTLIRPKAGAIAKIGPYNDSARKVSKTVRHQISLFYDVKKAVVLCGICAVAAMLPPGGIASSIQRVL